MGTLLARLTCALVGVLGIFLAPVPALHAEDEPAEERPAEDGPAEDGRAEGDPAGGKDAVALPTLDALLAAQRTNLKALAAFKMTWMTCGGQVSEKRVSKRHWHELLVKDRRARATIWFRPPIGAAVPWPKDVTDAAWWAAQSQEVSASRTKGRIPTFYVIEDEQQTRFDRKFLGLPGERWVGIRDRRFPLPWFPTPLLVPYHLTQGVPLARAWAESHVRIIRLGSGDVGVVCSRGGDEGRVFVLSRRHPLLPEVMLPWRGASVDEMIVRLQAATDLEAVIAWPDFLSVRRVLQWHDERGFPPVAKVQWGVSRPRKAEFEPYAFATCLVSVEALPEGETVRGLPIELRNQAIEVANKVKGVIERVNADGTVETLRPMMTGLR